METRKLRSIALVWITAGSLLAAGCGKPDDPEQNEDETGDTGNQSSTGSVSMTGSDPTDGSVDTTAGGATGMMTGGFLDPSSDGGPVPQPNGAQCAGNGDCESEFCFQIPMLGGVCSECLADTDCEMGTCSLDPTVLYAICTDGSIGVMCDSDEGCMGDLVCSELINTGGLFPLDFCSECGPSAPCMGEQICTPVYDLENIAGYMACADPLSVPNGGGCPLVGPVGDGTVCQSEICAVASLFDLIPVGVCSECADDSDCMGMATCTPPTADMSGLTPGTCM